MGYTFDLIGQKSSYNEDGQPPFPFKIFRSLWTPSVIFVFTLHRFSFIPVQPALPHGSRQGTDDAGIFIHDDPQILQDPAHHLMREMPHDRKGLISGNQRESIKPIQECRYRLFRYSP